MTTAPRYRVLVVDDNRDAATSVSVLFDMAGFEVRTCFDGPSALAEVDGFTPDACVLDIAMPGMDGYELARRLRERFADRPPVFATLTAFENDGHLQTAADAGFDLHFTKPATPSEVIEQLRDALAEGPPATEPPSPEPAGVIASLLHRLKGLFTPTR
jgi:two-component system OmpR family response regulator